jgi:hypothetical protein
MRTVGLLSATGTSFCGSADVHRGMSWSVSGAKQTSPMHPPADLGACLPTCCMPPFHSAAAALALSGHEDLRNGPTPERDHLIPEALKQAAAFRLSEGLAGEAQQLAARAAAGAQHAVSSARGSTGGWVGGWAMGGQLHAGAGAGISAAGPQYIHACQTPCLPCRIRPAQLCLPAVPAADVMLSPIFTGEALADAWLTEAQARMAVNEWEAAERPLSDVGAGAGSDACQHKVPPLCIQLRLRPCVWLHPFASIIGSPRLTTRILSVRSALPQALAAAEAVSGESSVRVALVLILTAHVYSRTGRVTLAEGLYREAAKMLHLSAGAAPGGRRRRRCWKHAMMLHAAIAYACAFVAAGR